MKTETIKVMIITDVLLIGFAAGLLFKCLGAEGYTGTGPDTAILASAACLIAGITSYILLKTRTRIVTVLRHDSGEGYADLKENVDDLRTARCTAEAANLAKSSFLNQMSHDIRTPMNAIVGYAYLLEQNYTKPEKVRDYARKITLSGRMLLGLISNVLDMSRIESGQVKLSYVKFTILDVLEEIIASIKPQSEEKNQNFSFNIVEEAEDIIFAGDSQRLSQIITNLLSNAVKYTPEGGSISLDVTLKEKEGSADVAFVIKDTGCGMSDDFLHTVFEPFSREQNPEIRHVQGTGLGMAIAANYVELMGGKIGIESEPGLGTTVFVDLNFEYAYSGLHAGKGKPDKYSPLKGMKFLIAEDNEFNAEVIREMLALHGAECVIRGNGAEAARAFRESEEGEYSCILMDIQMPVMGGYEAIRIIRGFKRNDAAMIPIIAMTADAFEEDVQKALRAGMDAHISKPIDMDAFINIVKALKKAVA